eukprot:6475745-Amphidinium_carterae.1
MNMRKKKDDIASFSQTLNYVLVHSTKPGNEAHSIVRRIMRQSSGFEEDTELNNVTLLFSSHKNATTKQFTRQCYRWLEDISRYESENGQGSITAHVKIATIINHLTGPIAQHLMLRMNNATTFTEVHQWISNFFNSTHTGTDDDNAAIGAVTKETGNYKEQVMIAFNKWYKGKGKKQWHKGKGKGKDKGGKKGDNNSYNYEGGKEHNDSL